MAKEKKAPKNSSDSVLSKDAETILIGLMVSLIAIIGLLNRGPIGEFLTFSFAYLFGVFYFLAYLIMLFFGLYLAVKRKALRIHIDVTLLGAILLFVGIIIAASPGNGEDLRLSNVFSTFTTQMNSISHGVLIDNVAQIEQVGGGLVGYFLSALLNTTITPIGTAIIAFILMVVGVILCLYQPFSKFKSFLNKRKEKRKEKEEALLKEKELEEKENQEVEEEKVEEEPVYNEEPTESRATKVRYIVDKKPSAFSNVMADDIEDNEDEITDNETHNNQVFEDNIENETPESPLTVHQEAVVPVASKVTYRSDSMKDITTTRVVRGELPRKEKSNIDYVYPDLDLLNVYDNIVVDADNNVIDVEDENNRNALERQAVINDLFTSFGIGATISGFKIGPSVTRYDVLMNRGVSVNIIDKYLNDISSQLGGVDARFEKIVRGKVTSGLEIPNSLSTTVSLKECLEPYVNNPKYRFFVPFGKDITGDIIGVDVTKYPHLLVAGATGNGKSVFIHTLIMSLIIKAKPDEVKLMLFDPKRVEFAMYRDIPHLLCPIIKEPSESKVAMNKLVQEMENRYAAFEQVGVAKISQYNDYAEENNLKPMPLIIAIVDEYADLVDSCKDISAPIVRLAAKSRACGIHLVISTQRPSVNVITGVIKANLPTRVALKVSKPVDSQTILGEGGAEKLLGKGDMLVDSQDLPGDGFTRVQSPYVDIKEIHRVVNFLKERYQPNYDPNFLDLVDHTYAGPSFTGNTSSSTSEVHDSRYEEIKAYVMDLDEISINALQRRFHLSFITAARFMDQLEDAGIVSKAGTGGNRRKVLIHNQQLSEDGEQNE